MSKGNYAIYEALEPYLELVRKGLDDLVDGERYFDAVSEDAVFEFLYEFPGWPGKILGRTDLMARYSGYGKNIKLHSADKLAVYRVDNGRIVILECEVHGTILATGVPYDNRLLSIITIGDRKIVRWRDYMDSLAAWNALTAPARQPHSANPNGSADSSGGLEAAGTLTCLPIT